MGGQGTAPLAAGSPSPPDSRAGWLLIGASKQARRTVKVIPTDVWTTLWNPVAPALRPLSDYGVPLQGLPWFENKSLAGLQILYSQMKTLRPREGQQLVPGHTAPALLWVARAVRTLRATKQTGPWTMKTIEETPDQTSCFPFERAKQPHPESPGPSASPGLTLASLTANRGPAGFSPFCPA